MAPYVSSYLLAWGRMRLLTPRVVPGSRYTQPSNASESNLSNYACDTVLTPFS